MDRAVPARHLCRREEGGAVMLATVMNRDPRRNDRHEVGPLPRRETLDRARRSRYLALLRRWAQERLPAGTRAALDAAEWVHDTLSRSAGPEAGSQHERESFLVRLRAKLLSERSLRGHAESPMPSSRVEQLIGRDQLHRWESALSALPRRQRELVILRVEFGLDYEGIAEETRLGLASARAETVNALAALIDALGVQRDRAA